MTIACKQTFYYYYFLVLFKNISELASYASAAVNKSRAIYILHPRSTDFEEKIEGVNRLKMTKVEIITSTEWQFELTSYEYKDQRSRKIHC